MPDTSPGQEPVDCWNLGIQLDETYDDPRKKPRLKQNVKTSPVGRDYFKILPKPALERRAWKRFTIDGAVILVAKPSLLPLMKPTYVKLGPVKDIGMKGLSVHYVMKNDVALDKFSHLSIVPPEAETVIDSVPFKIVNNIRVAELPGGKEVWNLCVSFGPLFPLQRIRIETLINEYGIEIGNGWTRQATGSEG